MCLLYCNKTADEELEVIRRAGYKNTEKHLAQMAALDTTEQANSLGKQLNSVNAWAKNEILKKVRKYQSSRHRFYFIGNHTECAYHLRFVLAFKKDETDQAKQQWFQNIVLKAVADTEAVRTLLPPQPEEAEE